MDLSIIILTRNVKKYTIECLKSIFTNLRGFKYEVIVVDNDSEDGTCEAIKKLYPNIRIIQNKTNLGFGKANNIGAKYAKGKYLIYLNPDTYLLDNSFKKIVDFFDRHQSVGVIGPKIYLKDEKTVQPFSFGEEPTIINLLLARLKLKRHKDLKVREVDWVTGGALFIRSDLNKAIGGFDKRFFMYFEDIDLCLEAKKRGYKVFLLPEARVVHLLGKSIKKNLDRKKIYWQSQISFYKKHYGFLGFLFAYIINIPRKIYLKAKGA